MSKVGKKPIIIPENVTVDLQLQIQLPLKDQRVN